MHAFDRQIDGQTEFSSVDRVCIPWSAVITMSDHWLWRRVTHLTLQLRITRIYHCLYFSLKAAAWRDVTWWNYVSWPTLKVIEQSAAELLRFQYLTYWPSVACCARLCDNFHQVWPSITYSCRNYSVFSADTLCHAVALTFDLLTLNFYSTSGVMCLNSVRNMSEIE